MAIPIRSLATSLWEKSKLVVRTFTLLAIAMVLFTPCRVLSDEHPIAIDTHIENVRKNIQPLGSKRSITESEKEYFHYYSLDIDDVKHLFGSFQSGKHKLAAHIFEPKKSKGTVIIIHGYYDHAGVWKHIIRALVAEGYSTAIFDLPGHGLSSGERASIDDFAAYNSVFTDFIRLCHKQTSAPYHVASHSTGGAVLIEHLLGKEDPGIDKCIMIAPLVRSEWWHLSGIGSGIAGIFANSVPRVFRKNSSDEAFLEFHKSDPLQSDCVPRMWVKAHRKWVSDISKSNNKSSKAVLVLQGKKDTTVDWKYNVKFLKDRFPNTQVVLIDGGGHQLINEIITMRERIIKDIVTYLQKE